MSTAIHAKSKGCNNIPYKHTIKYAYYYQNRNKRGRQLHEIYNTSPSPLASFLHKEAIDFVGSWEYIPLNKVLQILFELPFIPPQNQLGFGEAGFFLQL